MKSLKTIGPPHIDIRTTLIQAKRAIDSETGIIENVFKIPQASDEPNINIFTSKICDTKKFKKCEVRADRDHHGTGVNELEAKVKSIVEALERYSGAVYSREKMIYGPSDDLKKNTIKPENAFKFSTKQRKEKEIGKVGKKSKFWWVKGKSLLKERNIYVPSQLVYIPYKLKNEQFLRNPISTGLAANTNYFDAVYGGLKEVIEREAFMISYLNKIEPYRINIKSIDDSKITSFIENIREKNLKPYLFELETDIPICVYCGVLIDKTGGGPSVNVGACAHENPREGIIHSFAEALQARLWLRQKKIEAVDIDKLKNNPSKISGIRDRGLFWYDKSMISSLDFWLETDRIRDISLQKEGKKEKFNKIIRFFKEKKFNPVTVDVTPEDVKNLGFNVQKVVIPKMHPLYLIEDNKYLGGDRLYNLPVELGLLNKSKKEEELNEVPHPFL